MGDPVTATLVGIVLQVDLAGLQQSIQDFVATTTPTQAMTYGGGGVGSLLVVRWLLKRRSTDSGPSPAPTSVSTTGGSAGGVAIDEAAFTLPSLLPISKGIREVSHNEVHAIELGLVVGFVTAWLFSTGRTDPVITIVIAFLAGSLGFKRYSSKGVKTIRMEPWYALLAFAAGGALGWGVFVADPGLVELAESILGGEVELPV